MSQNAIWFSRHQPTAEQIADASAMGFHLSVEGWATEMASKSVETDREVRAIVDTLSATGMPIFGVFAAPVQSEIFGRFDSAAGRDARPCYAAWNVSRTPEGGRPTFTHKSWVQVGWL